MANTRRGSTGYVDTVGVLNTDSNIQVSKIIITATSASAIVVIADAKDATPLLNLRVATSGDSRAFDFIRPLVFPSGIQVLTLTNAIMSIVYTGQGPST